MEANSLRHMVNEAIDLLAHEAQALSVTVTQEPGHEPLVALCDKTQILQVIVNVMRNAFQALAKVPVDRRPPRLSSMALWD